VANFTIYYDYVQKDSYFKTDEFVSRLTRSLYDLREYYVTNDFEGYDKKTQEQKVSPEELKNAVAENTKFVQENIDNINEEYEYSINELKDNKEEQLRFIKERDERISNFRKDNEKTEEQIKEELIKNKDEQYKRLEYNVQQWKSIKYYLINKENGKTYTNLPTNTDIDEYIAKGMLFQESYPKKIINKDDLAHDQINDILLNAKLEGYILIPQEIDNYSDVYWLNSDFQNKRNRLIGEAKAGVGAFAISIVLLLFACRRKDDEKTILDNLTDFYVRIPMELRMLALLLSFMAFASVLIEAGRSIFEIPIPYYVMFSLFCSTFMLYILLHIRGFYNIIISHENFTTQWRGTLFYRTIAFLSNIFIFRYVLVKVAVAIGASIFAGMAFVALVIVNSSDAALFFFICLAAYVIFILRLIIKRTIYFNQVVKGSNEIVSGNFDYIIEEKGKDDITRMAYNFNNIKIGFKRSMEGQIKSERLKTELITNVSHDLKTPLTSIINYVDLLKNKELSEEEKDGYIEVLDRKAQRLKVLIEDLFEAAKMSSGAAELNREKVDIVAILRQTLGEFDEKINSSSLTFRANIPSEKIFLYLDGKKTWRVFENLINNALKYSQPNTRVYIDLIETETIVRLTIKNISNYEMDFDVEEIFERFKRGDKSRNTEGSGLGLAIAKSIVELQDGKMSIDIDGDLFKVIVEFKK
jgi:signal transduction histidine kinase